MSDKDLKSSVLARFGLGVVNEEIQGLPVFIRKISAAKYEEFTFSRMDPKTRELDFSKFPGMRAQLVAECLCDADGNPLFASGTEANDSLTNTFIKEAFDTIQRVNGNDAGAAQVAEKN